jgi:FixJ family two-component response regulator
MESSATIYLVDDDPSVLKALTRLLVLGGYEVKAYVAADELIESPITDENGCLVLDARMPGLSGFELHAELAAKGVKLPVIFVTAEEDDEFREKALAIKAAGFFRKPIDGPALLDAIAWALDQHKQH